MPLSIKNYEVKTRKILHVQIPVGLNCFALEQELNTLQPSPALISLKDGLVIGGEALYDHQQTLEDDEPNNVFLDFYKAVNQLVCQNQCDEILFHLRPMATRREQALESMAEFKANREKVATLPPDPDEQNDDRAQWAEVTLLRFMEETRTDAADAVCDLLTDLMHWCERNNMTFKHQLERAQGHYTEETNPDQG